MLSFCWQRMPTTIRKQQSTSTRHRDSNLQRKQAEKIEKEGEAKDWKRGKQTTIHISIWNHKLNYTENYYNKERRRETTYVIIQMRLVRDAAEKGIRKM